eukprot:TRINITY_DN1546_c1_g1_i7.p1 TRINITY_DN1546_c1_g1~~TRINITY_DN1546_c1_g1_i7.p1  ORF type:complete len:1126 (-),score=404.83 TRINITY_DN1546_c1_g1_i7:183-3560(-)
MVKMLNIISKFLEHRKWSHEFLSGSTPRQERQRSIDRFTNESVENSFVFLLSTKAGGQGLNLTSADTVIIFDSDWNPMNDLQAQARCHRIGQTQNVKVYRFITKNTQEDNIFARISKKLGLTQVLMSNDDGSDKGEMTEKEMENLLKHGAYHAYKEDEDADNLMDANIDDILSESTTVSYQGNKEGVSAMKFSTAFYDAEKDEETALNNTEFWRNLFPRCLTTQDIIEKLNDGGLYKLSPEELAKFMEDLVEFAQRIIQDLSTRSKNQIYNLQAQLGNILDMASQQLTDENHLKTVDGLLEECGMGSRSRSCRGRNTKKIEHDDDDASVDADDVDYHTPKKRVKMVANNGNWTKKDLATLKKNLNLFGFGRWEVIGEKSGLLEKVDLEEENETEKAAPTKQTTENKYSLQEIQALSENILSNLFALAKEPEEAGKKKTQKKPAPKYLSGAFTQTPLSFFLKDTKKQVTRDFFASFGDDEMDVETPKKQVIKLNEMKELCKLNLENPKMNNFEAGGKVTLSYTSENDELESQRYYILVTFKVSLPKSSVSTHVRIFPVSPPTTDATNFSFVAPGFIGQYEASLYGCSSSSALLPLSPPVSFSVTPNTRLEMESAATKTQTAFKNKFLFLLQLKNLVHVHGSSLTGANIPKVLTKAHLLVWWWEGVTHDKAALLNVWKEGYGQYPIFSDPEGPFKTPEFEKYKADLKEVLKAEKEEQRKRVKAVLDKIAADKKEKEKEKEGNMEVEASEEGEETEEKEKEEEKKEEEKDTFVLDEIPTASSLNTRLGRILQLYTEEEEKAKAAKAKKEEKALAKKSSEKEGEEAEKKVTKKASAKKVPKKEEGEETEKKVTKKAAPKKAVKKEGEETEETTNAAPKKAAKKAAPKKAVAKKTAKEGEDEAPEEGKKKKPTPKKAAPKKAAKKGTEEAEDAKEEGQETKKSTTKKAVAKKPTAKKSAKKDTEGEKAEEEADEEKKAKKPTPKKKAVAKKTTPVKKVVAENATKDVDVEGESEGEPEAETKTTKKATTKKAAAKKTSKKEEVEVEEAEETPKKTTPKKKITPKKSATKKTNKKETAEEMSEEAPEAEEPEVVSKKVTPKKVTPKKMAANKRKREETEEEEEKVVKKAKK